MILLSDEEIIMSVCGDCRFKDRDKFTDGDCSNCNSDLNTVAKAQLKQLHKWGQELCFDHNGAQRKEQDWFVKRHDCPVCWNALEEELG